MRVLHLRASEFYGGPERQLHFHGRLALDTCLQVTIASFTEQGRAPDFLEPMARDGVATHVFTVRSPYDPRAVTRIRRYLFEHDVDVLCTHEYRSTVLGWLATRGGSTRWVAFSRGDTATNTKVRLYHSIDKVLIRRADAVVAVSEAQKRFLERWRVDPDSISVVRNAIDVDALGSTPAVDLRRRFGLAPDTVVGVAGGRFSREKGQDTLVRAGAAAIARFPRLRLVLFGAGPDREKVLGLASRLGVAEQILCPGFETNILGCLRGADLLVNPSRSEGLPNIVLEGMALGVPVVATAVGGVPELVEDGRTGRLVPPDQPETLAEALVEVASELDRSRELARRALDFVRGEYGFERQFEQLRAIYEGVSGAVPAT